MINKRGLIVKNNAVTTLDISSEVRQCGRVGSSRLHETKKSLFPVQGLPPLSSPCNPEPGFSYTR